LDDGNKVGGEDGPLLGNFDGWADLDGLTLGLSVGSVLGEDDGDADSVIVGEVVGSSLGDDDGEVVGMMDGEVEG